MPLSDLPGELILSIADQLDIGGTSALSRTSSLFYGWLNGCLHRRDLTRHLRSVGHCSILIIEKTNLDQPPTLDFIVEFFRTQPTVPRPTVPSPQPYSLKSAVHHPPCSSIVHDLSTVHRPPRSTALHGPPSCSPSSTHDPPSFTILSPRPASTVHDPPQFAIPLQSTSPPPSTAHHPHPSHPNRITALPNGRPTSASWRQPGCSPVPSVRKVFIMLRKMIYRSRK